MSNRCKDCRLNLVYLHRIKAIDDQLYETIIAGHKNKSIHDDIMKLVPSKYLYTRLTTILPTNVLLTLIPGSVG